MRGHVWKFPKLNGCVSTRASLAASLRKYFALLLIRALQPAGWSCHNFFFLGRGRMFFHELS